MGRTKKAAKTEMECAIAEIISIYKSKVTDDVNARLRSKRLFLTDDEYAIAENDTRNFIDSLNYFADKVQERKL